MMTKVLEYLVAFVLIAIMFCSLFVIYKTSKSSTYTPLTVKSIEKVGTGNTVGEVLDTAIMGVGTAIAVSNLLND